MNGLTNILINVSLIGFNYLFVPWPGIICIVIMIKKNFPEDLSLS